MKPSKALTREPHKIKFFTATSTSLREELTENISYFLDLARILFLFDRLFGFWPFVWYVLACLGMGKYVSFLDMVILSILMPSGFVNCSLVDNFQNQKMQETFFCEIS